MPQEIVHRAGAGRVLPARPARPAGQACAAVLLCAVALLLTAAPAGAAAGPWGWPLQPQPEVRRGFEAPAGPFGPGHRGVDLAARVGQQVRSAGPGVVAFAGPVAGRGVVSVEHPDGRRTTYEPVAALVGAGAPVLAGALLGTVSAAPGHCLPGTCLHWGLRSGEAYLDPLGLLRPAAVRLLPVWGRGPPVPLAPVRPSVPVALLPPPVPVDRGPLLARS